MPSNRLVISPAARNDLKKIVQFGVTSWGMPRTSQYMGHIKSQFLNLMEHPEIGMIRDDLLPSIHSLRSQSHVIFYRLQKTRIEIVRVLHGRQDPQCHLK